LSRLLGLRIQILGGGEGWEKLLERNLQHKLHSILATVF
jgi:hypothetical protein